MVKNDTLEPPTDEQTDDEQEQEQGQEGPRFTIHPLRAGKSSLYEDAVLALIDAQSNAEIDPATGKPEVIAITVLVPADKKRKSRHLRDFREAAARHNRTARVREEATQEDGSVAIDFTLTERITRKRDTTPGGDVPEISDPE